jgi:hypothetical protein
VIVYDRHLADALVTLDFAYRGVRLGFHRRRIGRRMPHAAVSFYLAATAETAVARKPDDVIGEAAVRRQLEAYTAELQAMPEVVVLDASLPPEEITRRVLRGLLGVEEPAQPVTGEAPAVPRRR